MVSGKNQSRFQLGEGESENEDEEFELDVPAEKEEQSEKDELRHSLNFAKNPNNQIQSQSNSYQDRPSHKSGSTLPPQGLQINKD